MENGNRQAFDLATVHLADLGIRGLNPHDLSHADDRDIRMVMFRDIEALALKCDGLYMLRGWRDSLGARAEYHFGLATGMPIWGRDWFDERNTGYFRCNLEEFIQDGINRKVTI